MSSPTSAASTVRSSSVSVTSVPDARSPDSSRHARTSREDLDLRDGDHELTAPFPDVADRGHDLLADVPRQDQDEVRMRLADPVGMMDRDVRAGQEPALLV